MTTEPRDPRVRKLVFELMQASPSAPPMPPPVAALTEDAPSRARRMRLAAALLVIVIVVVAATVAVIVRRSPSKRGSVVAPTTTIAPATISTPSVAYVDGRGLVVRAAGSEHDVVVASGAVSTPRWSASGSWLAYRLDKELWVVRADGTQRSRVAVDIAGSNYPPDSYLWSPTVDVLAAVSGNVVRIWWIADDVVGTTGIEPPVGGVERSAQSIAWSRSGRSLAISMWSRAHTGPGAPHASLWLASDICTATTPPACSQPAALRSLYDGTFDEYPLFAAGFAFDDNSVLIWPDSGGSASAMMDGLPVKAVPIDGGAATKVATSLVRDSWVAPSPDGSQLVVVRSDGRFVTSDREIDVCDSRLQCRALAPGEDVQTMDPAWSPDSRKIAFVREEHGSYTPPISENVTATDYWGPKYRTRKLWIANADGSDAHQIDAAGGGIADPQFSSDGTSIVFVRDAQLWQLDLRTLRETAVSGSLRLGDNCTIDDCLPDAQPYETLARWSDHVAVKFPSANT